MKEAIEVNPEILADRQSHVNNILHPASGSAAGQNPSDAVPAPRKRRADAGRPRPAKAKETAPYYITPASGVRLDLTQAAGCELFLDWIEAAIIDQNKDAIVGAINTLLADVLKAKAQQ